mgnify:FL=1|jgi:tryptophan halogenase
MINKVVIVGGGTSGWLTAASVLHKIPNVQVTLIDKEVSTPVGVGEATLLQFDQFMQDECGFDRGEWIAALDAIPKSGILFPDWGGNDVWHPFYFSFVGENLPLCDAWTHTDYDLRSLLVHDPKIFGQNIDLNDMQSYAYHIDCSKLVKFIKKKLEGKIKTIDSEVIFARRDNHNNIIELMLSDHSGVPGDVFFDCTGFKQVLKNDSDPVKLLGRLFCDTAVAGHVDYIDDSEKNPYVSCPAVDHGWIWKIPLQSRLGTGLVFNRSITSVDEATNYFKEYWSGRVREETVKVIDWTPYYDRKMWSANVISIGLSAGFIEPLESTGIALITEAITKSVQVLSGKVFNEHDADLFNSYMKMMFEGCADFVSMHYDNSKKDTKFWRFVRETYNISDQHQTYIDNMKSCEPSMVTGKPAMFGGANWIYWMIQLGYDFSKKTYLSEEHARDRIDYFLQYKNSLPMNIIHTNQWS